MAAMERTNPNASAVEPAVAEGGPSAEPSVTELPASEGGGV
jgi:hypothetical protein